ncbi:Transposase, Mutator family [Planctomycetes bacterium Poly30]|uniref:Mutator family transposase n=1 Tax=Saltatorellus ferox TaxID=2528018 RepID=A0A518EYY0_9BACT|nr:Transposase, Mutator family [Planctomycetes bacterium Poly30]
MTESTPVHQLHPATITQDALTNLIRGAAQAILAEAISAEAQEHIDRFRTVVDEKGNRRVVLNGYLPEREIHTGAGVLPIRQPRVRVKDAGPDDGELKFQSKLVPRYLRKAKNIEDLIPWLYLRGISTNDMTDVLAGLLGVDPVGFSASSVVRCKKVWEDEFSAWEKRSLKGKRYVYVWADGVYFNVRLTGERACILVLIGATPDGRKEVIAIHDGTRESEQSWTEMLVDLKARGLDEAPMLAIGDGALGFWKAVSKIWPATRHQRCWTHKMANILNKLPKSAHATAKSLLQAIWMAETEELALKAFDAFIATYSAKYPKAVECLVKDKEEMLAFFDFPAEHWRHLRTSNPIESTFATVRQRTSRTKGSGSRMATLSMVFKLTMCAQAKWRRLNGHEQLGALILGVQFKDGLAQGPKEISVPA